MYNIWRGCRENNKWESEDREIEIRDWNNRQCEILDDRGFMK